jgi:deoxyribose-phosphate aldolase
MKHLNQVKSKLLKKVEGTKLGFEHGKIVKWIIEVAALNDKQIIQLSALIKNCIIILKKANIALFL